MPSGGDLTLELTRPDYCPVTRARRLPQEEPFEWGDPECLRAAGLSKDSTEYKLSTAAYRWRRKVQEEGKGILLAYFPRKKYF